MTRIKPQKQNEDSSKNEYIGLLGVDVLKEKKRKRVSKNKKKNWRKHIDITAVEDALEGERLEDRTTGNLSKKADDEIFFIETTLTNNKTTTKKEQLRAKRLHEEMVLVPNPEKIIPPLQAGLKKLKRKEKAKQQRLTKKRQATTKEAVTINNNTEEEIYDLWSVENVKDKIFKVTETDIQRDTVIGKRQVKRPKHMYKKANESKNHAAHGCPSVEVAHPGASYNPTLEDHQDLLRKAHVVEVDKVQAEEKIKRAVLVPLKDLVEEGEHEKEMAEGLFDEEDESDDTEEDENSIDESEAIVRITNPPVRAADRKTRRKRRKEQIEKDTKLEKETETAEKLRENEVFRTKTFMREIKQKEQKIVERKKLRDSRQRFPILSKYKFTPADLEIKLSSEIKGSLRQLTPEGGIALDRYKSLQKRGIIEPRMKYKKERGLKTKMKFKYKEKREHREVTL